MTEIILQSFIKLLKILQIAQNIFEKLDLYHSFAYNHRTLQYSTNNHAPLAQSVRAGDS